MISIGTYLVSMCILAALAVAGCILLNHSNKQENRTKDMIRYCEYQIEKEWISMLDICRELISMDAQRFEQIGELFGALPNMSPEQRELEFAHMEDLKKALLARAAGRYSEASSLANAVTRDTKYIARNIANIEQKWPKAVREYHDRVNKHVNKHVNESKEEHENT